jgi:hypothetical protein
MMGPIWFGQRNSCIAGLRTYHQGAEISREVERVVGSSLAQEHDVCNDGWLSRVQAMSANA